MTPEQVVQSTIICMVMIMLHLLVIATTCVYVFGTSHEKMVAWASMMVTYYFIALLATESILYMWSLLTVDSLLKWVMTSFVTYLMLLIALPLIQVCKQ